MFLINREGNVRWNSYTFTPATRAADFEKMLKALPPNPDGTPHPFPQKSQEGSTTAPIKGGSVLKMFKMVTKRKVLLPDSELIGTDKRQRLTEARLYFTDKQPDMLRAFVVHTLPPPQTIDRREWGAAEHAWFNQWWIGILGEPTNRRPLSTTPMVEQWAFDVAWGHVLTYVEYGERDDIIGSRFEVHFNNPAFDTFWKANERLQQYQPGKK